MCRPFGAVNYSTLYPTVSTVGYVVTSLRDFEGRDFCRRHPNQRSLNKAKLTYSFRASFIAVTRIGLAHSGVLVSSQESTIFP